MTDQPDKTMGEREEIPEGIYFSIDNFYDARTLRGCGSGFYRKWSHRWSEFPLSAEAALAPQEERS